MSYIKIDKDIANILGYDNIVMLLLGAKIAIKKEIEKQIAVYTIKTGMERIGNEILEQTIEQGSLNIISEKTSSIAIKKCSKSAINTTAKYSGRKGTEKIVNKRIQDTAMKNIAKKAGGRGARRVATQSTKRIGKVATKKAIKEIGIKSSEEAIKDGLETGAVNILEQGAKKAIINSSGSVMEKALKGIGSPYQFLSIPLELITEVGAKKLGASDSIAENASTGVGLGSSVIIGGIIGGPPGAIASLAVGVIGKGVCYFGSKLYSMAMGPKYQIHIGLCTISENDLLHQISFKFGIAHAIAVYLTGRLLEIAQSTSNRIIRFLSTNAQKLITSLKSILKIVMARVKDKLALTGSAIAFQITLDQIEDKVTTEYLRIQFSVNILGQLRFNMCILSLLPLNDKDISKLYNNVSNYLFN